MNFKRNTSNSNDSDVYSEFHTPISEAQLDDAKKFIADNNSAITGFTFTDFLFTVDQVIELADIVYINTDNPKSLTRSINSLLINCNIIHQEDQKYDAELIINIIDTILDSTPNDNNTDLINAGIDFLETCDCLVRRDTLSLCDIERIMCFMYKKYCGINKKYSKIFSEYISERVCSVKSDSNFIIKNYWMFSDKILYNALLDSPEISKDEKLLQRISDIIKERVIKSLPPVIRSTFEININFNISDALLLDALCNNDECESDVEGWYDPFSE